jgi:hypothetical protein
MREKKYNAKKSLVFTHFSKTKYIIGIPFFPIFVAVGASFFGDMLQPQGGANGAASNNGAGGGGPGGKAKIVSGDLDASLANLTSNLNLTSGTNK